MDVDASHDASHRLMMRPMKRLMKRLMMRLMMRLMDVDVDTFWFVSVSRSLNASLC